MQNPQAPDDRPARIQALARRLLETEAELRALTDGQLDAIVDPDSATPLLLRGAQDALRDSEARARALVERLPTIAAELALDGTTHFVNDAVTRILGYEPDDLVGRPWWPSVGVSGGVADHDLAVEDITDLEQAVTARDGSRREAVWSSARVLTPEGEPRAILVFGVDITERRRAEQAAHELIREQAARAEAEASEKRAALLSEAGRLLGSALRYEATLTSIARLAVTGIAEYCIVDVVEEDTGPRRVDVAHPDLEEPDPLRERLAQAAPGDPGLRMIEHVIEHGETRTVPADDPDALADAADVEMIEEFAGRAIVCAPLNARGHTLGAITVISARGERYNNATVALVEELARRAALAVDNARLYEEALAASAAKSEFLAVMSHELRTPLNAIMGYSDLLLLGVPEPVPDTAERHVKRVKLAATHLLQMIDEILTLSRIEAGEEFIEPETVEFVSFFRETAGLVSHLAEGKGLDFDCQAPDGDFHADIDQRKVRQILLNLIGNAVKFTAKGSITVVARLSEDTITVAVEDTGMGIEEENLEAIFEPFWQVARGRARTSEGAGLGLNVARRLARMMGGDIVARSIPGDGATFTLTLPRNVEPTEPQRRRRLR